MIEQMDVEKYMEKDEYRKQIDELEIRIGTLQRELKELNIPVMIVFEGVDASGKGTMINRMISSMDPRGFQVFTLNDHNEEEQMRPYFWRFMTKTPERGRIHIYDQSWYQGVFHKEINVEDANHFEGMLSKDGYLIVKFFLIISKEEQKRRLKKLEKKKETRWRVTKKDKKHHKEFKSRLKKYDEILIHSDTDYAPWTVVESTDKRYATCKILFTLLERMERAVRENKEKEPVKEKEAVKEKNTGFSSGVLNRVDLSLELSREEYEAQKKEYQKRLYRLQSQMYRERVPVVLAFEGWDAGGKGGAIKRLTQAMDPRGYQVIPTASPNDIEKAHHYLWRFWEHMPKAGHMAIFDRTWYGRVMVERIEEFATPQEWGRAYQEINEMEEQLVDAGCIVLKFWMHIDKDEQERRFKDREERPEKQWKITEEDWRNRARWDDYEKAVDEMILRTSTPHAPWIVVEANSKLYARIKVLKTVVEALEQRLGGV